MKNKGMMKFVPLCKDPKNFIYCHLRGCICGWGQTDGETTISCMNKDDLCTFSPNRENALYRLCSDTIGG